MGNIPRRGGAIALLHREEMERVQPFRTRVF
jgi:hypothetical protein